MWPQLQGWSDKYARFVNDKYAQLHKRWHRSQQLEPARATDLITPGTATKFLVGSVIFALLWIAFSIWSLVMAVRCVSYSQNGPAEKILTVILFLLLGPFYLIYYYVTHTPAHKYCKTAVDHFPEDVQL
jgi:uncharacterized membrane protein YedE/YeeE